jgi:phosphatidylinositol N-acetylglucosaminyltransferase subunit A
VVFVSRLVFRKGVDLLVGIIPAVCRRLPHVDFIVGGDGPRLADVQNMVDRYGLQKRVELVGSVPHARVRDVLVHGDVFLNCSLTESFCIAILEASSCGLLVVSTNVGGVPEVLPPDLVCLASPNVPDMVECLVAAIRRHETDPLDRIATHARIRQMYSWERVAIETERVYETVIARPRPTLHDRLRCYRAIGFIAGIVACFIALTVELWFHYVEWWLPRHQIEVVPSLCGRPQLVDDDEQHDFVREDGEQSAKSEAKTR